MKPRFIDIHCHLFNRDIIGLVIRGIGSLKNQLQQLNVKEIKTLEHQRVSVDNIQELLNRLKIIVEVIQTAKTSEELYQLINKTYHEDFILIPLMMDISFIISDRNPHQPDDWKNYLNEMKDDFNLDFHKAMDNTKVLIEDLMDKDDSMNFHNFIAEMHDQWRVIKEYIDKIAIKKRTLQPAYFNEQIEQMKKLTSAHPGMIYPFLAVDPARPDIVNIVKENVGKDKLFRGLKFYPPCGFSPSDPGLMEIYEYAEKHQIPITTHCSYGGFCTFANEIYVTGHIYQDEKTKKVVNELVKFEQPVINFAQASKERNTLLAHPLLWKKVLKRFPKLYLNFGHFGGMSDLPNYNNKKTRKQSWAYHIIKLMKKYDNVYADISNYGDNGTYNATADFKEYVYNKKNLSRRVKQKFLYGTDFYLMYLFQKEFDEFTKNYRNVFGDEFQQIASINPSQFLKNTCPELIEK